MEQEKKDGNYSLNTLKDIWKYDPLRLLDLGNIVQLGISNNKPGLNEEARAITNFEKLTEDRPRPVSHTLIDASRVLPDIAMLIAGPIITTGKKIAGKKAVEELGENVAKTLVREKTNDGAKDLTKSLLLTRDDKDMAAKAWIRKLWENKEAMNRAAGKNLTDKEISAVRNAIPDVAKPELDLLNNKVDNFKVYLKNEEELSKLSPVDVFTKLATSEEFRKKYSKSYNLTQKELDTLMSNLKELGEAGKSASFSHYNADRILKGIPKEKHGIIKDTLLANIKSLTTPVSTGVNIFKLAEAGIHDVGKTSFETNKKLEMRPDYWTRGSEPTPVSDFFASVFNVDFDDPARFNKKDIDTFFEFLEDVGTIEPGIKDKWTPRQKISVMRELVKDDVYGPFIKRKWAESEHKKNLTKYYSGE